MLLFFSLDYVNSAFCLKKLKENFEVSLINNNNSNTYRILKLMATKF